MMPMMISLWRSSAALILLKMSFYLWHSAASNKMGCSYYTISTTFTLLSRITELLLLIRLWPEVDGEELYSSHSTHMHFYSLIDYAESLGLNQTERTTCSHPPACKKSCINSPPTTLGYELINQPS